MLKTKNKNDLNLAALMIMTAAAFGAVGLMAILQLCNFGAIILHFDLWDGSVRWSSGLIEPLSSIIACAVSFVACILLAKHDYKKFENSAGNN